MGNFSDLLAVISRQTSRLLTLQFPHNDPPQATDTFGRQSSVQLVVDRLVGDEGLSRDFCYTLDLLCDNAHLAHKDMLGKLLVVLLTRPDGTRRPFSGYITTFELIGSDAGMVQYRAVLRPWLHFLSQRQNNRVLLAQNLRDQTATLLADYGTLPQWKWQVRGPDAPFTMAVQGGGEGESDYNYLHRRWEEAGYSYWWEHDEQGHTLVISDDTHGQSQPVDGDSPNIRFHAATGSQEANAISRWSPEREWVASQYATSGFDFKHPQPRHASAPTLNKQGEVPRVEAYEYTGAYGFRKEDASGDALTNRRMEEIEARAKQHHAVSNHYGIQPGRWFQLIDHFSVDDSHSPDSQFLILDVHHEARNNYLQAQGEVAAYSNRFTASRKAVPWRPGRGYNSKALRLLAPQTATVVGLDGSNALDVDEYGRVMVVFHWDREHQYSARVRVASNWAGGETGMAFFPRIGSEVVIQHLDGNADHPLITGVVYNADRMPPWTLADQKALSGIRSRELAGDAGNSAGGRSNHVIFDDSAGQLQLKLRSDQDASELTLGHNVRIDGTQGRTEQRGQGVELRTDGHGAVRAAKGLLLTTEARPSIQAHMTDMGETTARLHSGQRLHDTLSQAAQQVEAHEAGDQDKVTDALQRQNEDVQGGGAPGKEFQQPHLTLASPIGIQSTTAGSTHIVSDEHTAITSGDHTSIASGRSLLVSVKEAIRLFAYKAGLRLVAASADIDLRALKQNINILAKLDIQLEANKIRITAKEAVEINGGTSFTRWNADGIEHGTHGNWQSHAAAHQFDGPGGSGVNLQGFPAVDLYDEAFQLHDPSGKPMHGIDYTVTGANEDGHQAKTVSTGRTPRVNTNSPQKVKFALAWAEVAVGEHAANPAASTTQDESHE